MTSNPFFNEMVVWETFNNKYEVDRKLTHIFKISVQDKYKEIENIYQQVLSSAEIEKANRYIKNIDAKTYIVSRYFTRVILSTFLKKPPLEIQFQKVLNQKPFVDGIEFNISHSGNYVLLAVSPDPIGIDIEFLNPNFNVESLTNDCFDTSEYAFIMQGANCQINFYTLWTRKEAILKASGEGIVDNLQSISIMEKYATRIGISYEITSNLIDNSHIMSLAVKENNPKLCFWNYV